MANKQDIITSVKNLYIFLRVPALVGSTVRMNKDGTPYRFTGGFNMVFQLEKDFKKWAFRVWHVPMKDTKERYQAISRWLNQNKLSYFSDFSFDEKGLVVNGDLLDTSRMEWVEGLLLKKYLAKNLNRKTELRKLAEDFKDMCQTLKNYRVSHGDLQEGNIIIDKNGGIKLIDYDSLCIPELEGQREIVTGLKGYQHPSRFSNARASLKADYFSELIIYLSILGIAENPQLWDKYEVETSCFMLFKDTDFVNLKNSPIYRDLKGLTGEIDSLLEILQDYLAETSYLNLKPFYQSVCQTCGASNKLVREVALDKKTLSTLKTQIEQNKIELRGLNKQNKILKDEADLLRSNKKEPVLASYGTAILLIISALCFFIGRVTSSGKVIADPTPTKIESNINDKALQEAIAIQPFLIQEIKFSNNTNGENQTHSFTSGTLQSLTPILNIIPLVKTGDYVVQCKIIKDNYVWRPTTSKFTYTSQVHLDPTSKSLQLDGWTALYSPGKYIFEAWVNDRHIGTGVFRVQ